MGGLGGMGGWVDGWADGDGFCRNCETNHVSLEARFFGKTMFGENTGITVFQEIDVFHFFSATSLYYKTMVVRENKVLRRFAGKKFFQENN